MPNGLRTCCNMDCCAPALCRLLPNAAGYLKSPKEMAALFEGFDEALARSVEIADECRFPRVQCAVSIQCGLECLPAYELHAEPDALTVVHTLGGPGGSVSPDGRRYWFALADGDRHHLAELDLASGQVRIVKFSAKTPSTR